MKTLKFSKEINAPAQKVWDILWNADTYPQWTDAFNPPGGSSAMESDWQVGGKTLFTDGKGNGMVATIKSMNKPNDIVFEHLGELADGKEDTTSDKVKEWAGALEEYHLTEQGGITTLETSVQMLEAYADMMNKGFEKGLEKVKELSEK